LEYCATRQPASGEFVRPDLSSFHANSVNSPNQTANLYSFNSVKNATVIRPVTREPPKQSGALFLLRPQLQQYRLAHHARLRLPLGRRTARTVVTKTPGASQGLDVLIVRSATGIGKPTSNTDRLQGRGRSDLEYCATRHLASGEFARPGFSSFHTNSANSPNQAPNLYSFNSARNATVIRPVTSKENIGKLYGHFVMLAKTKIRRDIGFGSCKSPILILLS